MLESVGIIGEKYWSLGERARILRVQNLKFRVLSLRKLLELQLLEWQVSTVRRSFFFFFLKRKKKERRGSCNPPSVELGPTSSTGPANRARSCRKTEPRQQGGLPTRRPYRQASSGAPPASGLSAPQQEGWVATRHQIFF